MQHVDGGGRVALGDKFKKFVSFRLVITTGLPPLPSVSAQRACHPSLYHDISLLCLATLPTSFFLL